MCVCVCVCVCGHTKEWLIIFRDRCSMMCQLYLTMKEDIVNERMCNFVNKII